MWNISGIKPGNISFLYKISQATLRLVFPSKDILSSSKACIEAVLTLRCNSNPELPQGRAHASWKFIQIFLSVLSCYGCRPFPLRNRDFKTMARLLSHAHIYLKYPEMFDSEDPELRMRLFQPFLPYILFVRIIGYNINAFIFVGWQSWPEYLVRLSCVHNKSICEHELPSSLNPYCTALYNTFYSSNPHTSNPPRQPLSRYPTPSQPHQDTTINHIDIQWSFWTQ